MKIYLVASLKADAVARKNMSSLADHLRKAGHIVNDSRIQDHLASKPKYNEDELSSYHKTMMNSIKQCDVMITDISSKSSGLGYEIAVALNEKKPILALYHGSPQENSSLSLKSNPSKLIQVHGYEPNTINDIADAFIRDAKDKVDTKFILIISPEIDKYLAWAAEERRMHKAQVVRNSIEETIANDTEYQQFLADMNSAA